MKNKIPDCVKEILLGVTFPVWWPCLVVVLGVMYLVHYIKTGKNLGEKYFNDLPNRPR